MIINRILCLVALLTFAFYYDNNNNNYYYYYYYCYHY